MADKDKFYWIHVDAVERMPFFNMTVYQCPHCQFTFHNLPRDHPSRGAKTGP